MIEGVIAEDGKLIGFYFEEQDFKDLQDFNNLIRLQSELLLETNNYYSLQECNDIWQWYSWELCASWLFFPDEPTKITSCIKSADTFVSYDEILKK